MNTFTLSTDKVYASLLILFLVGFNASLIAQKTTPIFSGTKLTQARSTNVIDNFADFTVVDFDLNALNDFVSPQNSRNHHFIAQTVQLQMGQYHWTVELYQDNILAEDFQLITIKNGRKVEVPINKNKTYAGYLKGTNDEVRLTLDDGFLSGVVYQNGQPIYIEPLSRFEADARPNQLIIYEGDKVMSPSLSCAHNDAAFKMQELEESAARFLTNQCYEVRFGIASDASVFNSLMSVTAVNNFMVAVFNNIRPIYRFAFGDNIEFLIAQQYVSQATANDPFSPNTTSTDASTLLANFGTWMAGNGFGTTNLDLGSVWVSRNIFLNGGPAAGVANFGLCTALSNRTQIIQYDANASAAGYACLVSHETGHNFHATHVSGANIMNPSCSASLVWDPSTVTTISNHLNSSDCISGANALTTCATPVAGIGGGGAACVGQPITFKDNSQFGATRTWATSGGNITSGTGATHTVTYSTAGTYPISLTSTNANGSNTTNTTILVTNSPAAICAPNPNTGQGGGGISRFALANVDNTSPSGANLNEKLEDFACTDIISLEKNTMYTLTSLTIDFGTDFNNPIFQGWKVYIDYNNNGDFTDSGEEIINHGNQLGAGDIISNPNIPATAKSFTTPSNPVENTLLRLRVVVDDNTITPCMNLNEGQMEDYGVIFKAIVPCPTDLATTTAPAIGITNSTCATTGSFTAITCASGSTAQYSTDNGTNWSAALPSYNAVSAMTVLTRCNCDTDNSISSMTNTATTVPVIKPTVTKPTDQTVTVGGMTTAVTFSGTANATYAWTNDNTNTGVAASGNGNMPAYTTTNTGVSNITVTPTLNGCAGTPQTFKITVNAIPCPTIGSLTGTATMCSGDKTTSLTASGLTNMGTTNDIAFYQSSTQQTTTAGVYGLGFNNSIGGVPNNNLTNNGTEAKLDPVVGYPTMPGTYYIYARLYPTPSDANCRPFKEFVVTIKDTSMVAKPTDQAITAGGMTTAVTFSGTANATYAWTNDNTNTGVVASGNGNIPAYTTTNAGVSNITVTPTLNGCAGTPQTFKITVNAAATCPTIGTLVGVSTICANDQTTTLTASNLTNMGNNEIDFYYSATQQTTAAGVYGLSGGNLFRSVFNADLTNNKTEAKVDSIAYPFTAPGTYYIYARIFPVPSDANCQPFKEFVMTVKDTSMVVKPADQTVNVGDMTTAVTFSGTANATYAWTNDNANTGIPANGTGNMIAYTTITAGVSNITVTPTLNGCAGTSLIFKITVNASTVSNCPTDVTIMSATISGDTAASATIITQNTVVVNGPTTFSAPTVTLKPGFSVPTGQAFTAHTTGCTATPTTDGTCNAPFVLTCGQNYSGNNISNGSNNWDTYKMTNGYTGKEVIHKLDILAGDEVALDLTGNTQDLILVALGSCDNTADIVLSDNAGDTNAEQIVIPKDDFVNRTVFIVVDGWDGAASNYTLSCTATSSGPGGFAPNSRISQITNSSTLSTNPELTIYPNPATQFIDLDYIIKEDTPVEIGLYDLNGAQVKTFLHLQEKEIGRYQTKVGLVDIEPGMYFIMLRQEGYIQTKKLVVTQ